MVLLEKGLSSSWANCRGACCDQCLIENRKSAIALVPGERKSIQRMTAITASGRTAHRTNRWCISCSLTSDVESELRERWGARSEGDLTTQAMIADNTSLSG